MMNLRISYIISGKTWIIHRKTYLWKYGPQLLHKLWWWSLFYRERYIRLLLLWTLEGPIQLPVTCQFWFEYPQFSTIEECAPLLEAKKWILSSFLPELSSSWKNVFLAHIFIVCVQKFFDFFGQGGRIWGPRQFENMIKSSRPSQRRVCSFRVKTVMGLFLVQFWSRQTKFNISWGNC
jgi:hypothetical protein